MPMVRAECRLVHIFSNDADLMIARTEVQFGEEFGPVQLVQELFNDGDRKLVLDGCRIESPIIDAEALGGVLLPDQQHRR